MYLIIYQHLISILYIFEEKKSFLFLYCRNVFLQTFVQNNVHQSACLINIRFFVRIQILFWVWAGLGQMFLAGCFFIPITNTRQSFFYLCMAVMTRLTRLIRKGAQHAKSLRGAWKLGNFPTIFGGFSWVFCMRFYMGKLNKDKMSKGPKQWTKKNRKT